MTRLAAPPGELRRAPVRTAPPAAPDPLAQGLPTTLERLELKYLVDERLARALRQEIAPYCVSDAHDRPEHGGSYPIVTLYLDTPCFDFYQQKKRREMDRIKLRVRTYGPETPAVLEVKRKCGDVIRKTRAVVPRAIAREAARGDGWPLYEEQRPSLERFAFLAARTGAGPVTLVRYFREAWVSRVDAYARVTMDRRIGARLARGWELGDVDEAPGEWCSLAGDWLRGGAHAPVLLELKCERRVPGWMARLITRHELRRKGFSKYCRGLEVASRWRLGLDAGPGPRGPFV